MNERTTPRLSRDRILDVARHHFATHGYRKASLSEIAAELGVVKGALYYHVPGGKQELLDDVMAREEDRMLAAMAEAAAQAPNASKALVAGIQAKLGFLRELKDLLGVRREVGEELSGLLGEREREYHRRERAFFEQVLQRGENEGTFRAVVPRSAAAQALQAVFQSLEIGEIYGDPAPAGQPRLLEGVLDLLLLGLEKR